MSEYLYGKILKIKKTNHVYAQLSSLNKKDRDQLYTINIGTNPDNIKEGDRIRVEGTNKQHGQQVVMYASSVKVYPEVSSDKGQVQGQDAYTFRITVGNAANVAYKWKGLDIDINAVAFDVYLTSLSIKEYMSSKYSSRDKTDIGMKVGAALLHAADVLDENSSLEQLKETAMKFMEDQINLEEYIKNKMKDS